MSTPAEVTAEVTVPQGRLRGVARGPVRCWLGVPYAAPPVGPRRFRSPQPAPSWAGVRPAAAYGPAASQPGSLTAPMARLGTVGEDCLHLNVWAPAAPGPPRAVLVWIHGGAFAGGSGALYDGGQLAADGDVVVVTINYRLGVFGFVDLGAVVDAELPANLGLRDQIAALAWVQENIAAFGGDPDRVTVAGESAGSISIALLSCAPSAAGAFAAMIMQSGSHSLIHGPQTRREVAARYGALLGLGPGDEGRLAGLPAAQLLATQQQIGREITGTLPAAPWFDGELVPGGLAQAQAATRPEVPLLIGHNHDEVTMFQRLPGDVMPTTRPALEARLHDSLGPERAAVVLARYPDTAAGTRALGTELNFAGPTRHFADRHAKAGGRTFLYRYDAAVPVLGATHASELPLLWGWRGAAAVLLAGPRTPARRRLGERLRRYWTAFVRDHDPGPDWPGYGSPGRPTKIFSPGGDEVLPDPAAGIEAAWAGADVMPRG